MCDCMCWLPDMLQTEEEKIKVLDVPRTVVLDHGLVRTEYLEEKLQE